MTLAAFGRTCVAVVGCLAGVGVTQYAMTARRPAPRDVTPALSPDVVVIKQAGGRVWQQHAFTKGGVLPHIGRPGTLKVAANGDVLVFDWNGMRLKRFDRDGAPITTYEVKDAVGSAALANPTDFDIAPDGSIWLADPPKGTIVVFEPTGAVRRVITLEHSASHIVHLDGSRFATLPGRTVSHLFEVRRADSVDAVNAFGEFLPDWQRDSISLSGALGGVTKEGLVVFGAYFTGLLAAFDGEGRIHYVTEAINRLPLPTIQLTSNGARRVYKDAPVAMRSLGISESHVVVSSPDDVGTALALDLYDASNGKYEYSISLPQGASRAYLAGHRLYTTTRNSVTWWTMK